MCHGALSLALRPQVEVRRAGICTDGRNQRERPCPACSRAFGEAFDVVVIDEPKGRLRSRLPDRRPERAHRDVASGERFTAERIEAHDPFLELRVPDANRSPRDRDDLRVPPVVEQQVEAGAADQTCRARERRGHVRRNGHRRQLCVDGHLGAAQTV